MEDGIGPSLKGAITPEVWFSLYFLISFLFPYLTNQQGGFKWGAISVAIAMLMLALLNTSALLVFGSVTEFLMYPLMQAARYIAIAQFLEHLESFAMAIWVSGVFVKLCVFYYALVLSTAQWLRLQDHKPIVFPMGLFVFSVWSFSSIQEMSDFSKRTVPLYENTFYLIIPVFLLLIALVKRKEISR